MSEPKKPDPLRLGPNARQLASSWRNHWAVNVAEGHSPKALLEPEYWAFHSAQLRPYDRIEARWEDGSYFAEYVVLSCDRTWAKVYPVCVIPLTTSDVALSQDARAKFDVAWKGPSKKFCVIRKSDSALVHEGVDTKPDAEKWLEDNLTAIS